MPQQQHTAGEDRANDLSTDILCGVLHDPGGTKIAGAKWMLIVLWSTCSEKLSIGTLYSVQVHYSMFTSATANSM